MYPATRRLGYRPGPVGLLTFTQELSGVSMKPWMIILVSFLGSKLDFCIVFSFCTRSSWPCAEGLGISGLHRLPQVGCQRLPTAEPVRGQVTRDALRVGDDRLHGGADSLAQHGQHGQHGQARLSSRTKRSTRGGAGWTPTLTSVGFWRV